MRAGREGLVGYLWGGSPERQEDGAGAMHQRTCLTEGDGATTFPMRKLLKA